MHEISIYPPFSPSEIPEINAEFDGNRLILPVSLLSEGVSITVTAEDDGIQTVFDDWEIDKVERPENSKDISSFTAIFNSDKADDYNYTNDTVLKVEISNGDYSDSSPYIISFKVVNFSDYILWNSYDFEQVK